MKRTSKKIDRSLTGKETFPVVVPKTENQTKAFKALDSGTIVALHGCAGTGKSYLALYKAAHALQHGKIARIVLIRAYQPLANRSIGFIPGTLEEKLLPYYQQMLDYLEDFLGKERTEFFLKKGAISICSLETIRGRSWDDAFVFIDEAQNLFEEEIQALVTRVGRDCKMVFAGDISGFQHDNKTKKQGLEYLLEIARKYKIPEVENVEFGTSDILRSDVVKSFVIAFDTEQRNKNKLKKGTNAV